MDIHPIHTEADYKATLKEISALMESDPDLGTLEGDRLDILATLVQAYEAKHMPITAPDPVEAIKFRMDQSGLSVKDLEPIIGKSNCVYEVLNRKRPSTCKAAITINPGPCILLPASGGQITPGGKPESPQPPDRSPMANTKPQDHCHRGRCSPVPTFCLQERVRPLTRRSLG